MKKWKILNNKKETTTIQDVIDILFENRSLKTQKEREKFLNPEIYDITLTSVGLDAKEFKKFKKRIEVSIEIQEKTIIFGDYDVDGICASAILWETLFVKNKSAVPYIPERIEEGYGLSKKGIDNVLISHPDTKLIITVDNGIVAYDAIDYAKKKGIDIIVTDHHALGKKKNNALCILHTVSLCGAGIAWVIAKELGFETKEEIHKKLELAMLATIADLVPLVSSNRAIVKEGLQIIKDTKRIGLQELLLAADIDKKDVSVYTVSHILSPRLNASGRIDKAINALRLLCTHNREKAKYYSSMLGIVNRDRQDLTLDAVTHAKTLSLKTSYSSKITIVADKSYNPGVIGIVASQMVESYYRPSFAISIGEEISKGSARSITGVNIIELLRSVSPHLIEVGGHPMAAGFSVKTVHMEEFFKALAKKAESIVTDEILERFITIDALLPFSLIDKKLFLEIEKLSPFGMGNPEPVFGTENVGILDVRRIGKEGKHLKMKLSKEGTVFDAVGFGLSKKHDISIGDMVGIAYTIDENEWQGKKTMQLKVKDIRSSLQDTHRKNAA